MKLSEKYGLKIGDLHNRIVHGNRTLVKYKEYYDLVSEDIAYIELSNEALTKLMHAYQNKRDQALEKEENEK